jgi:hypothetical protein
MPDYLQQLNSLRFWNRLGIFLFVAFLPIGALILALGHYFRIFGSSLIVVFFAVWVVLMAIAYYRIRTFRCPKCGKCFIVKHVLAPNSRGRKCVHCGLKLYEAATRVA